MREKRVIKNWDFGFHLLLIKQQGGTPVWSPLEREKITRIPYFYLYITYMYAERSVYTNIGSFTQSDTWYARWLIDWFVVVKQEQEQTSGDYHIVKQARFRAICLFCWNSLCCNCERTWEAINRRILESWEGFTIRERESFELILLYLNIKFLFIAIFELVMSCGTTVVLQIYHLLRSCNKTKTHPCLIL